MAETIVHIEGGSRSGPNASASAPASTIGRNHGTPRAGDDWPLAGKAHYAQPLLALSGDGLASLTLVAFRPLASSLERHGYQKNNLALRDT